MVVGWTLHAIRHGSLACKFDHCNPCKKPAERPEERKKYRAKLLSIWLNSVSDDLDLITDWWFFVRMYAKCGIALDGGFYAKATLALLAFCILASMSYVLELYQTVFKYPDTFRWLAVFTIFFEDVPQVLLSLILSGSFDAVAENPTPLAAFNISTSVYHALVKVSGQVFLNSCYCCTFTAEDADRYFEAPGGDVEMNDGRRSDKSDRRSE